MTSGKKVERENKKMGGKRGLRGRGVPCNWASDVKCHIEGEDFDLNFLCLGIARKKLKN